MTSRDKLYLLWLLLCVLYAFVLHASGCAFRDSPLGFVKGCYRYGVDWNSFMAPLGMVALLLLPLSVVYFVVHACELTWAYLKKILLYKTSSAPNKSTVADDVFTQDKAMGKAEEHKI